MGSTAPLGMIDMTTEATGFPSQVTRPAMAPLASAEAAAGMEPASSSRVTHRISVIWWTRKRLGRFIWNLLDRMLQQRDAMKRSA